MDFLILQDFVESTYVIQFKDMYVFYPCMHTAYCIATTGVCDDQAPSFTGQDGAGKEAVRDLSCTDTLTYHLL